MATVKENLQKEAEFQDKKVEGNVRKRIGKVYQDAATAYTCSCKELLIGDVCGKHLLEVGCGRGETVLGALRKGAIVTAIDISPKSIELLIECAKKEGLSAHLQAYVMDAHHLKFPDESFDIVTGNGILHHLPDLEQAMREISRVMKSSGYGVFHEPLGMNPALNLFRLLTPNLRTRDEQPFRMKELKLIQNCFKHTTFTFFDLTTLLGKPFVCLGARDFANALEKQLIRIDDFFLRRQKTGKITVFHKLAWMVLIRVQK